MNEEPIDDLIERSSLGTPGARRLRARTPRHVVERILRRVTEIQEAEENP